MGGDHLEVESPWAKKEPCPFGCIFHKGHLHGDCRVPWSDECYLNVKDKEKRDEAKD